MNIIDSSDFPSLDIPQKQGNAGCIVKLDGKLLAVRTVKSGKWDIPAGKPENDETPAQTAVRETFEETGINVKASKLLENFDGDLYVYQCIIDDVNFDASKQEIAVPPTPQNEVSQVAFIDINTLTPDNFRYPSILDCIKKLFHALP